jgi:hypothetical protein
VSVVCSAMGRGSLPLRNEGYLTFSLKALGHTFRNELISLPI